MQQDWWISNSDVKWKKADTKDQMLSDSIYVKL